MLIICDVLLSETYEMIVSCFFFHIQKQNVPPELRMLDNSVMADILMGWVGTTDIADSEVKTLK